LPHYSPNRQPTLLRTTPVSWLALNPQTKLYFGLVHFTDGMEGTPQRIATA